jgi:hypothetical protein
VLISAQPAEKRIALEIWEERFGVPGRVMEEWLLFSTGSVLWGLRDAPQLDEVLEAIRCVRTGIPMLRKAGRYWKPTTVALQVIGLYVTRNVIELSAEELDVVVIEGELRRTRPEVEPGYVALAGPDGVVGCGLYLAPDEGQPEGLLISQLPKARWSGLKGAAGSDQTLPGR